MSKRNRSREKKRRPVSIEARWIVSGRNLEPFVQVMLIYDDKSEEQVTQWTPAEAQHHAFEVLLAAEAGAADAFMVSYLVERVGLELEKTGGILQDFRDFRLRRRAPERAQ